MNEPSERTIAAEDEMTVVGNVDSAIHDRPFRLTDVVHSAQDGSVTVPFEYLDWDGASERRLCFLRRVDVPVVCARLTIMHALGLTIEDRGDTGGGLLVNTYRNVSDGVVTVNAIPDISIRVPVSAFHTEVVAETRIIRYERYWDGTGRLAGLPVRGSKLGQP